jgi:hypothetical protein
MPTDGPEESMLVESRHLVRWFLAGLVAVLLAAACSSPPGGGQGTALAMQRPIGTDHSSGVDAGVITEVDVPVVFNRGPSPLHVLSVQLTDPPSGVHVSETDAYHTSGIPVGIMSPTIELTGSLSPGQPRFWGKPRPVTAITLPAHGRADWVAVIVFTAKPGTYRFTGVKITYMCGGEKFWQAESLGDTVRYSAPHGTADHQG